VKAQKKAASLSFYKLHPLHRLTLTGSKRLLDFRNLILVQARQNMLSRQTLQSVNIPTGGESPLLRGDCSHSE